MINAVVTSIGDSVLTNMIIVHGCCPMMQLCCGNTHLSVSVAITCTVIHTVTQPLVTAVVLAEQPRMQPETCLRCIMRRQDLNKACNSWV